MIPKFKDRISFHGLFLEAAKRRILDEPHRNPSDKAVQERAIQLLKQTNDLRPRVHKSGKPISSNIEIGFLKEFKFFVSLMNAQAGRLEQVIRSDAKDAFATIHEMQRELVALDTEVEEKEIELLGNYSKVYLNTFTRSKDSQLQYTDKSWLVDFKTGFTFQERYMMDTIPSAGAVNPIQGYSKAPIVDAVIIDELCDVGDSITPFVISNPRNVFRKNKVFKYVVVRQEFDTSTRKFKSKTSFDTFPWSCRSTMTMQIELANVMHVNTLKIHPLGDSTISIKEIRYVNESGEEIALNTLPIDNHTEIVVLFEPIFTKHIIIQFEQYAHLAKTKIETGDRRVKSINNTLDSRGFTVRLPYNERIIEGRAYDFSLREIEVGLSKYENKGFFRGQNIMVSSPVGMEISKQNEAIVPTINYGTYSESTILPEGNVLQEAYVGVRLFDNDGNKRMDDICPVLDTGLVQLEYLSPISNLCRYKLFPDLHWSASKHCIDDVQVVEICEEWTSLVQTMETVEASGNNKLVDTDLRTIEDIDATFTYTTMYENQDYGKDTVSSSADPNAERSTESVILGPTNTLSAEDIQRRQYWVGKYNSAWPTNTRSDIFRANTSDLDVGVDVTVGTIDGRKVDMDLLKAFNSGSSIAQTGKLNVQIEYTVSDSVLKEYFGEKIYNTMSASDIARIKQDPILHLGIGGRVMGGGRTNYAYAEARQLYSTNNFRRGVGRRWVSIKHINVGEKPTSIATEVFKFEISMMSRKPRTSKKIGISRKDEQFLNRENNLLLQKKKIIRAIEDKSSLPLLELMPLANNLRNSIINTRYGYKWNSRLRIAERVIDNRGDTWPTAREARRNKRKLRRTSTDEIKHNLIPLDSGSDTFVNGLKDSIAGRTFTADTVNKDNKDSNPNDPEIADRGYEFEPECTTWNYYYKITTPEQHGLFVGDTIVVNTPGNPDTDGMVFTVSIVDDDYTFYIIKDSESEILINYYVVATAAVCFLGEPRSTDLFEVYENNALLTIGEDYEISMDDGSTWYPDWPEINLLSSDFYRKAGAGRFYIRLLNFNRSSVYWTKYFVKRNQYLSPCKQVYLRNGRVVFNEKLKYTTGTLQPILINRMNSTHPYVTGVTTEFSLAIQSRDIVNNPSAQITEEFLNTYLSGESLNVT